MINEFHFNTSQFDLYNSCKSAYVTTVTSYLQCKYTQSRLQEFGYCEHPATMSKFFSPKIRLPIDINVKIIWVTMSTVCNEHIVPY